MRNLVVLGTQWGDEGKGKIVDLLTERFKIVVRYQGGANAGHTVVIGGEKVILHLVPSGILRDEIRCVIGNGVVIEPRGLLDEIDLLHKRGLGTEGRLFVSDRAQLVLPFHKLLDELSERSRGADSIGTTCRGIGPAYTAKAAREGLRVADVIRSDGVPDRLGSVMDVADRVIKRVHGGKGIDFNAIAAEIADFRARLEPYVTDTTSLIRGWVEEGLPILFEGAQGTMLDIDFGTYPYVTSSNTTVGGACTGAGVPPRAIEAVLGVHKAYTTRVGKGPFPTEDHSAAGDTMRLRGAELGSTTGRPRRCGWQDAVVARYAAWLNGVDALALTKLDVLDAFEEIPVCRAYELDGDVIEHIPAAAEDYERCRPVYEKLPGWRAETTGLARFEDLPANARRYVDFLSELIGVTIPIVSTGPDRSQTIIREELLEQLIGSP